MLTAALDGRAIFLVAGAVLGVGIYGFALTFKPYDSGRVLQPFPVLQPAVMTALQGPVFEPPAAVLPEAAAPADTVPPRAPGGLLVSLPRTIVAPAPQTATAPPVAAAASGPATPLEPVPTTPAPRELPPIVIAPENVLVYVHPGYGRDGSEPGGGAEDPTDEQPAGPVRPGPGADDDDGESDQGGKGNGKERRSQKRGPGNSGAE